MPTTHPFHLSPCFPFFFFLLSCSLCASTLSLFFSFLSLVVCAIFYLFIYLLFFSFINVIALFFKRSSHGHGHGHELAAKQHHSYPVSIIHYPWNKKGLAFVRNILFVSLFRRFLPPFSNAIPSLFLLLLDPSPMGLSTRSFVRHLCTFICWFFDPSFFLKKKKNFLRYPILHPLSSFFVPLSPRHTHLFWFNPTQSDPTEQLKNIPIHLWHQKNYGQPSPSSVLSLSRSLSLSN